MAGFWERISGGWGIRDRNAESGPDGPQGPPSEWPADAQLDWLIGDGSSRSRALKVAVLFRCVTLISSTVAEIVSNSIYAVDFDRKAIDPQPDRIRHLLRTSPDGECSAYALIDDLMMDLLLDGNALLVIDRMDGRPYRLRRMISRTAMVRQVRGRLIYDGEIADPMGRNVREQVDSKSLAHARWADMTGRDLAANRGGRTGFVPSPLVPLADDLQVSREIIRWIAKFYASDGGTIKADHSVIYPDKVPQEEQKTVLESIAKFAVARKPLVLFGGPKVESLKTLPQDAETSKLRDQEIENIGRVYGIPPPLMGLHTTQWGSGISELSRLYWTYAARPAMNRLLQPLSLRLLPMGQDWVVNEMEMLRGDITALTSLMAVTKGSTADPVLARSEHRSLMGVDTPFPEGEEGNAPAGPASLTISWAGGGPK